MNWENIILTVITALLSGGFGGIVGWRAKKRLDQAEANKVEEEAKASQIDNIRKTMDEVYKPIIDDLKKAIADARQDAERACERVNELEDKVDVLEKENRELRRENSALRDALEKENRELRHENSALRDVINEIRPDVVASKRIENLKQRAASMPRSATGQFVKKEDE